MTDELTYSIRLDLLRLIDSRDLMQLRFASENDFYGLSFKNAVERVAVTDASFYKAAVANQLQNLICDGYVKPHIGKWRNSIDGATILNSDIYSDEIVPDLKMSAVKVSLTTKGREHLQSLLPKPVESEALRLSREANTISTRALYWAAFSAFAAFLAIYLSYNK